MAGSSAARTRRGSDYPMGRSCPRCPFWAGIDRFTHEPIPAPVAKMSPKEVLIGMSDHDAVARTVKCPKSVHGLTREPEIMLGALASVTLTPALLLRLYSEVIETVLRAVRGQCSLNRSDRSLPSASSSVWCPAGCPWQFQPVTGSVCTSDDLRAPCARLPRRPRRLWPAHRGGRLDTLRRSP